MKSQRAYIHIGGKEKILRYKGIKGTMKTCKHTVPNSKFTWQDIINFWAKKKKKKREKKKLIYDSYSVLTFTAFFLLHTLELHKILPCHFRRLDYDTFRFKYIFLHSSLLL